MANPFEDFMTLTNPFKRTAELVESIAPRRSDAPRRRAQEMEREEQQRQTVLFNDIFEDKTISDVTRNELLSQFVPGVDLNPIRSTFSKAKEGLDPKFKARQTTQNFLEITRDRPGQRQTRFVDSVSNVGL